MIYLLHQELTQGRTYCHVKWGHCHLVILKKKKPRKLSEVCLHMTHSNQIVCLAFNPFIGINYAGKRYLLLGCQQNALCLGISENARIRFSTKTQRYPSSHSTRKSLGWTWECLFLVYTTFPQGLSLGTYELLWGNSSYLHQSIWTLVICRADTQVSVCGSQAYCNNSHNSHETERCQHSGAGDMGYVLIVDVGQAWALNKKRRREEQITAS